MQRLSYIAFATIMMAFAAWGTSRYFSVAARVEDDESIADLDGFDSAPTFVGKSTNDSSSSTGLGPAMPILSAPAPDVTSQDLNSFLSVNSAPQSDVWLTGTIEEIDGVDTIPLPDQISEKPDETSVFR